MQSSPPEVASNREENRGEVSQTVKIKNVITEVELGISPHAKMVRMQASAVRHFIEHEV